MKPPPLPIHLPTDAGWVGWLRVRRCHCPWGPGWGPTFGAEGRVFCEGGGLPDVGAPRERQILTVGARRWKGRSREKPLSFLLASTAAGGGGGQAEARLCKHHTRIQGKAMLRSPAGPQGYPTEPGGREASKPRAGHQRGSSSQALGMGGHRGPQDLTFLCFMQGPHLGGCGSYFK